MSKFDSLLKEPLSAEGLAAIRREQFAQANASLALEGLTADATVLAIQERVINGELTTEQAVALCLRLVRRGA